jgi:UDP-N-acetylmuramoyl-tripeptide--D-alanyl-D-alanine ligase
MPRGPSGITSVVHDTRNVTPGAVFVAFPGARCDGHDLVGQAAERGAVGAVIRRDRLNRMPAGFPVLVVEDTAKALGDLATGYRRRWGRKIVGVTGSVGKTTVKEMIAALLATTVETARTRGNWNNEIGLPLCLLAIPETAGAGVLELGISHPGEMAPLCRIAQPDWGVITSVGPVHLEFFESVTAIAREKGALFAGLPSQGVAVASSDETHFDVLRGLARCRIVTTSVRADADYTLVRDDPQCGVCEVRERQSGDRAAVSLPLPGAHNRRNLLLAIAVARGFGVSWPRIDEAMRGFVAPPMRWERRDIGGIAVINDAYNANPLSMRAALDTFADVKTPGRKWLALGDMLELGQGGIDEHAAIGRLLGASDWAGLVTVGTLAAHLADGAAAAGMPAGRIFKCATAGEAATVLLERLRPGDALLVKASRGKRLEEIVERLAKTLGA